MNLYTYCYNNPISFIDPSGNFFESAFEAVKGAVITVSNAVASFTAGVVEGAAEAVTAGISDAMMQNMNVAAPPNPTSHLLGKIIGNMGASLGGAIIGTGGAAGGMVLAPATGGASVVAGGAVAVAGAGVAVSGAAMAGKNIAKLAKMIEKSNEENNQNKDIINQLLKSKKSYEKLLAEHQLKLEQYIADPDAFDNLGLLKDASAELRQKIIDGRIDSLKMQITKQEGELAKITEQLKNLGVK